MNNNLKPALEQWRAEQAEPVKQEPVHWVVPDFGFLFPSEDAAKRYLTNIESDAKPAPLYAAPVNPVKQEPVAHKTYYCLGNGERGCNGCGTEKNWQTINELPNEYRIRLQSDSNFVRIDDTECILQGRPYYQESAPVQPVKQEPVAFDVVIDKAYLNGFRAGYKLGQGAEEVDLENPREGISPVEQKFRACVASYEKNINDAVSNLRAQHANAMLEIRYAAPVQPLKQEPVHWVVPDFGFLFPSEDAAKRYLTNIESDAKPAPLYAAPVQPVKQEPVGRVMFVSHRKAPDVDWASGVEIKDGMQLYAAPVDAKAIRAEALEEAAKVCDEAIKHDWNIPHKPALVNCAAAIRGLK